MLGFALALAMVKRFRGRSVVMSILIVPLFVSPVIVGQFWALFLQRPFGPTDYLLSPLLRHPVEINWLSQFPWNLRRDHPGRCVAVDAVHVRHPAGRPQRRAAGALRGGGDGRGIAGCRRFVYITLPQMGPMILLAVTFRLLDAVKLFDTVFMMTGGGPGSSTYTCPSTSTRSASRSSICRRRRPEAGCSSS